MNSARDVNITENSRAVIGTTGTAWQCFALSTHTREPKASAPASTTEPEGPAKKKAISLKPSDPYPTWPFTQVEPKSLERWCKRNLKPVYQIEEAPF